MRKQKEPRTIDYFLGFKKKIGLTIQQSDFYSTLY